MSAYAEMATANTRGERMKTQTIYVDACTSTGIAIGRRNTYATEQIVFGLAPLVQQYGAGSAVLMVLRPTDTTPYPAVTSQSGTELTWTVSATDTSVPGTGECELYWYVDGGLAKSVIFPLTIQRDIITEPIDEPPEPYQTWVDDLTDLGAETLQNAQAAAQSVADAEAAKTAAQTAQTGAEAAKTAAQGAQAGAETARTGAEAAQTAAETAQGKAEDAQEAAESAKTDAEAAARQAEDALEEFTTPTASANTLEPDEEATASYANGHFTFGIPQGVPGDPGDPGVTPDFSIGTVQTLQPTEPATASITGTAEHPVLNLGIPQGVQGDPATNLVQSVNGKTGAVVLGAGDIGYDGETTYPDASVGKELGTINSALSSLQSVTEIIDTASGAIASFPDGAGLPMRSLVAEMEPVQDLHGQDAPYPAGAKNLIDASTLDLPKTITSQTVVATYSTSEQTKWTVSAIVTNNSSVVGRINIVFKNVSVTVGNTYTEIPVGATNTLVSATLDASSYTFTDIRLEINGGSAGYSITVSDAQINKGDPLDKIYPYSNICPISGWTGLSGQRTGKNLFDKANVSDVNGYFGTTILASSNHRVVYIPCKPNTTYTVSNPANNRRVLGYTTELPAVGVDVYGGTIGTITTGADAKYLVCYCYNENVDSVTYQDVLNAFQFELGSTASPYEEYTGEAISVSFGRTVYGGTDEVIGGNGTSTMGMVDLGDLNWSYSSGDHRLTALISDMVEKTARTIQMVCSAFKCLTNGEPYDPSLDFVAYGASGKTLYVHDSQYTDATAFKTAMAGVKLVYELATPTTFTHEGQEVTTLYGQNNVWVDTGDVSVTYQASIKGYIDKVLGA